MNASHLLLQRAYKRKKKANPHFSMSAIARGLDVSKPFVSQVFHGKRKASRRFLSKCFELLDMGPHERDQIYSSLAYEKLPTAEARAFFNRQRRRAMVTSNANKSELPQEQPDTFELAKHSEYQLLSEWQRVAILDLVSCVDFEKSASWISARLGISEGLAAKTVDELLTSGLLVEREGRLEKSNKKLEFLGKVPLPVVRKFHRQMIEKGLDVLRTQTTDDEFRKRLITGLTVATNPERVEAAKTYLQAALMEFFKILETEEATDVYQLNFQLFPLTKPLNQKEAIK